MKEPDWKQLIKDRKTDQMVRYLYRFRKMATHHVLSNNGSEQDAEDIFQDALFIFIKNVLKPGFELMSKPETFLQGIVKNSWYSELRRRGKLPQGEVVEDLTEDVSDSEAERRFSMARTAFEILGEKCREILILFYYAGMSMSEIAVKVGLSNDRVVKVQKYRCLDKAKQHYEELRRAGL